MDKKQFVQVIGYELKRITFVPAKNPDAHSIKPADLGFILLNDPVEVNFNIFMKMLHARILLLNWQAYLAEN